MLTGRILVVSPREDLVEHLSPLLSQDGHVTLAVPNGTEALAVLEEGIIPDVVILDDNYDLDSSAVSFLARFRTLNQLGQQIVISGSHGAAPGTAGTWGSKSAWSDSTFEVLEEPLDGERVRTALNSAMDEVRQGLQNLRGEMLRETDRLQKAIRAAQFEMVTALAVTMEAKDPYMRGHCGRVSERSQILAERLGLSETAVEQLRNAALLHEIGKIGISLDLLHKKGALAPEELAQIRSYTKIGADIIGAIPSLAGIAPLIRHLHADYVELPSLFPDDDEARLSAAILRVVDAHDAMTNERSYRDTLSRDRWSKVLREGTGSRFDPRVVQAFLEIEQVYGEDGASASR